MGWVDPAYWGDDEALNSDGAASGYRDIALGARVQSVCRGSCSEKENELSTELQVDGPRSSDADSVRQGIREILRAERLLTIATVTSECTPHVNTCYFAESESSLDIYVLTPPDTLHARNIALSGQCAANIFSSSYTVGQPIAGLQLRCHAARIEDADSARPYALYASKHPSFATFASDWQTVIRNFSSRFYVLQILGGKLIDERNFDSEESITFRAERTE